MQEIQGVGMLNTNHTSDDISDLKSSALSHLWMHNRDWVKTGEDGGPDIMVEGNGIRFLTFKGKPGLMLTEDTIL